jgi:hypothetical protein
MNTITHLCKAVIQLNARKFNLYKQSDISLAKTHFPSSQLPRFRFRRYCKNTEEGKIGPLREEEKTPFFPEIEFFFFFQKIISYLDKVLIFHYSSFTHRHLKNNTKMEKNTCCCSSSEV